MAIKNTNRPTPRNFEYGNSSGYKKTASLFGFVFSDDITKWYGRQKTTPRKPKSGN